MFTRPSLSPRERDSSSDDSIVYVVDDDEPTRHSLSALFRSVGLRAETFGSTREFLSFSKPTIPSCLILDVRLPQESGLELQQQLLRMGMSASIVFISGHGDIPMTVQAMKAGARDFLTKPFRDQDILDAVSAALRHDTDRLKDERSMADLRYRYDSMNAKERAVMNLSEITIKTHRAHAMKKMASRTLAEFVRIGEILGIEPERQFLAKRN
jgi:FixJ family two-component response regulator